MLRLRGLVKYLNIEEFYFKNHLITYTYFLVYWIKMTKDEKYKNLYQN